MALLPVEEARHRILKGVKAVPIEMVRLDEALGRVLARPVTARRSQPPFAASAMDGYAVMSADVAQTPTILRVTGQSAAGHGFSARLKQGSCIRIFTGAPLPKGADAVVIQENAKPLSDGTVQILQSASSHQHVRAAGLDFRRGEIVLHPGTVLGARDIGVAAAANAAVLAVRTRPRVAILATGDELVRPGERPKADQIVSSNSHALAAMAIKFGATVVDLGIVGDDLRATERAIGRASKADILLTTGGASVGDHDFMQQALQNSGVKIDFWKIAMRPGKPFMYGRRKNQHVIGLPGNPVSAQVCARLFLLPLIATLLGQSHIDDAIRARLGSALKANDSRQDYVRSRLAISQDGQLVATAFSVQDSSMQRQFREADALIIRPPHAPAAKEGDVVDILRLEF